MAGRSSRAVDPEKGPERAMLKQLAMDRLQGFLAALPPGMALKLAKAVEFDWVIGGNALPHDLILTALRPALREAGAGRTPTPCRLFCRTFDDLLVSTPSKEKRKGRIARSAIAPVWTWLTESLIPDEATAYGVRLREAVLGWQLEDAEACAAEFRATAAKTLRAALASPSERKALLQIANGAPVLEDADEIAILLDAGDAIVQVQNVVPRYCPGLSEERLLALRTIYDQLVQTVPDAVPYVAVVAMKRLERPWEALRLPLMIARQSQDTLISSTDMGLVGETLLADLDSCAMAIRSVRQPQFDAATLVENLKRFALISAGIVKEVEMRRDGRWGKRLMGDRAAVAEIMESMMRRAPREILAALPTLKIGSYAGGPKMPDVSHAPDGEKSSRARSYAALLAGCRPVAPTAAFGAALSDADNEITTALTRYCDDLVAELRAAEGERLANAVGYLSVAIDLATILFSAEEAEFLRRRGRAATGVQAAA